MKILSLLILVSLTSCAIEKPSYSSVRKDGMIEIRKYEAIPIVSAPMKDMGKRDESFRSLFRYITGANLAQQKIAMTSPVFMEESQNVNRQGTMSFMLPAEVSRNGAPQPEAENLKLSNICGGMFAVYRFTGWNDKAKQVLAIENLNKWLTHQPYKMVSSPFFAFYDPPWIPEIFRRNEVWQRIEQ